MAIDAAALKVLIERELERVSDDRIVAFIRRLLVEPDPVPRDWDYGEPGQQFVCWTVLDDSAGSDTGIAYCDQGFGPRCPWGLVSISKGRGAPGGSIGMDSGWLPTFLDAFFESMAATELPHWRVFQRAPDGSLSALTGEIGWTAAWEQCKALSAENPTGRYDVDCDLAIEVRHHAYG